MWLRKSRCLFTPHHVNFTQVKALVDAKLSAATAGGGCNEALKGGSEQLSAHAQTASSSHSAGLSPLTTTYLIDVRSPQETQRYGMIPTAINIPVHAVQEVLGDDVTGEEFEAVYGIPKPTPATHALVFYCQHGMRSATAADIAESLGFRAVSNYGGSFVDWAANVPAASPVNKGKQRP